MRAAFTLTLDGNEVPLYAGELRRSLVWPVGTARCLLVGQEAVPDPGAAAVVKADSGSGAATLMTGTVVRVASVPEGAVLELSEASAPAARLRLDRDWQNTTADQIIADLADAAGIDTASPLAPGAMLPFYTALAERTVLEHMQHLAQVSGSLLWTDAEGRISLAGPVPSGTPMLLGPERAVSARSAWSEGEADAVRILGSGAGPTSANGIAEDPASVAEGDEDAPWRFAAPALKNAADLAKCRLGLEQLAGEATRRVDLRLAEVLDLDLNDLVLMQGHDGIPDGPARVAALAVRWSSQRGLECALTVQRLT